MARDMNLCVFKFSMEPREEEGEEEEFQCYVDVILFACS